MVKDYKQLRIWQQSIVLAKLVYGIADLLPDQERYGLRSQLTRSVVSVASNIAEGSRRKSTKDLIHFLTIALGSLAETETQIIIGIEVGFFTPPSCAEALETMDAIARGIVKLKQTLEQK